MRVIKITITGYEDYPMFVEPTLNDVSRGIDNMLEDREIFDQSGMFDVVEQALTITLNPMDMLEWEFRALEPWEP